MFSNKIAGVFGIFMILLLLNTGFISAAVCKGYDGYWRSCPRASTPINSFKKLSTHFWEREQTVGKEHSHAVDKITYFNPGYYKLNYNVEYSHDYDTGVYGYDKFTYYDNGYEHEYKYGEYGYENTKLKVSYEEKNPTSNYYNSNEKSYYRTYEYIESDYTSMGHR